MSVTSDSGRTAADTSGAMDRGAEAAAKLALLREALAQAGAAGTAGTATATVAGAGAIRLRGPDWFAWATAGADAAHCAAAPAGVDGGAELLVTRDEACILCDAGAAEQLRGEPVPAGFTFHIAPWAETELHDTYVLGAAGAGAILSDWPRAGELPLPAGLRLRRMALLAPEQARLRALGRDAALAASEALRAARPDWTELDLAAAAAAALWRRGAEPARVTVAGSSRLAALRQPAPTAAPLGARALLGIAARRHGLVASLARGVAFGALSDDERTAQAELLQVEATGLDAVRPGQSLAAVYHALDAAYRHANRPDAIAAHHQGGIGGYAAHEMLASASTATGLETGMAFAFNPGFGGVALGDTFLLGEGGLENLTLDPAWPATTTGGRVRPLWLETEHDA